MTPPAPSPTLRIAWKVVAALAAFGALVLGVGFALPGSWTAERTARIDAEPTAVFRWLDDPDRWREWTAWGGIEATRAGPRRGEGAALAWSDPYHGDGTFTLTGSRPPTGLTYRVVVQGGSMVTEGRLTLAPLPSGGTRVTWTEAGDFGWNPLMGYAALGMERAQGLELERALERLADLVEAEGAPR